MGAVSDLINKGLAMIPKGGKPAAATKPVSETVPGKVVKDNSGYMGSAVTEAEKRKKATEEAAKATE